MKKYKINEFMVQLLFVLVNKLGKKSKTINVGNIVSSKLGEISRNIAFAFKMIEAQDAVLFFYK